MMHNGVGWVTTSRIDFPRAVAIVVRLRTGPAEGLSDLKGAAVPRLSRMIA